jgi:diguanylate cyclase (GGDEF)-like protein
MTHDPKTQVGHRRRPLHAVLAVVVAALFVMVELLVLSSYRQVSATAQSVNAATDTTATLANLSRETLLLRSLILDGNGSINRTDVQLHRGLLEREVLVLGSSSTDPALQAGVETYRDALVMYDRQFAHLERADADDYAGVETVLGATLHELDLRASQLFDSQEYRLYGAIREDLAAGKRSEVMLGGLGGFGLLLGTVLAFFLRRSVRRDFARGHDALLEEMREREILQEQLAHQAFHDSLTGLANMPLFTHEVERAVARAERDETTTALIYLDLDGFKEVNDTLGHEAGDDVLRTVAGRLVEAVRTVDTVARIGGDEFAIVLEGAGSREEILAVATRLLAEVCHPIEVQHRDVAVSASIGIVADVTAGRSVDGVVRDADLAMYQAKALGKARYVVFEPRMREAADLRTELVRDLERAIVEREFRCHYQPIVDLATGRIDGMEALVRWIHPSGELRLPNDFIDVAEETGQIDDIGDLVMADAVGAMAAWHEGSSEAAAHAFVSVNVSAHQLRQPGFPASVAAMLKRSGLAPSALVVEVTESVMMLEGDETVAVLRELRSLGIRVAIDDFGTGYSSLSYLRFMPVDILKLDRSFVSEMGEGREIIEAVTRLATTLGIQVVAEGVEEREQWDRLVAMGCRFGQGFLIGKPAPAAISGAILEDGLPHLALLATHAAAAGS